MNGARLNNVSTPSISLGGVQPNLNDTFYAMVKSVSAGITTYTWCLLRVAEVGSSNVQPYSVEVLSTQVIFAKPREMYTKHIHVSSIAGTLNFSYHTSTSGLPTSFSGVVSELSGMVTSAARISCTGVWIINGKMCIVTGMSIADISSGTIKLYATTITTESISNILETSTNISPNAFKGAVEMTTTPSYWT